MKGRPTPWNEGRLRLVVIHDAATAERVGSAGGLIRTAGVKFWRSTRTKRGSERARRSFASTPRTARISRAGPFLIPARRRDLTGRSLGLALYSRRLSHSHPAGKNVDSPTETAREITAGMKSEATIRPRNPLDPRCGLRAPCGWNQFRSATIYSNDLLIKCNAQLQPRLSRYRYGGHPVGLEPIYGRLAVFTIDARQIIRILGRRQGLDCGPRCGLPGIDAVQR